ncbi:MAG: deoxyribose-phosphate aldolase [Anaerococcus sp.]|uniref:deoxyribose-phosphate aldolase n=1 Tax=Anaerococcus sp. TaxID=1872515 RepID=UPI0026243B85|nr:deoxyribose-phosphate aldolase [Anaerococcus sp.]MCI5972419.1 deoxyribose-phosphate aldolase [Anaerococcus sp.]MDD6919562.1 deoxyribose-phosphate aldolase [Peptoniphilaceae bacterium]MDY2928586.1 deoxyribose-phosphate aldolase [Anaerococcus sp.]
MKKLNSYIDHTNLKPEAQIDEIKTLVDEAIANDFYSVCVNSTYVKDIKAYNKDVRIAAVVGFPLGAMATRAKAYEAKCAVEDGASEIDMVIPIGRLKDKDYDYVLEDIRACKEAIGDKILKVIIETCLLTDEEKIKACELAEDAGADFVKTSTGFSTGGANASDVRLMKKTVGDRLEVKASGGIHTRKEAMDMIEAGASRIGASKSIDICKE